MLESIRRHSRSTIIYVLFGVLIAVFVINFGPGSGGCGSALSTSFAARVSGSTISEQDYRMSYIALGGPNLPPAFARERRLKEFVMDKLIERELLAQEAERLGFRVSEKEVAELIGTGKMYILGVPRRADEFLSDGVFDLKRFRTVVENRLGVTEKRFIEVQQREMLADKVKQVMMGTVKVTPAETKADFDQHENKVNLTYVRFQSRQFESQVELTPEEIADYAKKNEAEIKKQYEASPLLYKGLEKQVHLRQILIAVDKDEKDEDKIAKAERKANKLRGFVVDKHEDFAAVAKDASDDASKARGGDLGWRKKGMTGLSKELEDKVLVATAGDIIGPEKTERGFELIKLEGVREGDVPLEQAAGEIAEAKLRAEKAREKAKAAADEAAKADADGKTLAERFPKPESEGDDKEKRPAPATGPVSDETGLFARGSELVPQVGVAPEVMKAAFTLKQGQLAGPFDVAGTWVVVQVKERKEADAKEFEDKKADQTRTLERQKWADVLDGWVKQRCVEARDGGRIKWNDEVLAYEQGPDCPAEQKYVPCGNKL